MANLSANDFLLKKYPNSKRKKVVLDYSTIVGLLEEFHELKKEEAIKNLSEKVKKGLPPQSDTITT